jgi:hypothetical protein
LRVDTTLFPPFLGPDSLLGEPDEELKILSQADRMPEAPLLDCNVATKGSVRLNDYAYFKVRVEGKQSVVKVKLVALSGDPDVSAVIVCARERLTVMLILVIQLYVGNGRCPRPDKTNCTWKKSGHGDDVVTIYYFDARFAPGYLYIGVHGATQADFLIKVVWKDVDIVQAGSMPSPGHSRLSNGTPSVGEKSATRVETALPVLPKILNPTKGKVRTVPPLPLLYQRCSKHCCCAGHGTICYVDFNSLSAVARDLLKNVPDANIVEDVVGKFQQWRS